MPVWQEISGIVARLVILNYFYCLFRMKKHPKNALFVLFAAVSLFCATVSPAQFPAKNYPQGYFRNPLNIPMSLSGNFGELRPDHYHMGLDLKTLGKVNLPVYAVADGYVSRIKIEPNGFGRAIYINHINGFTSLYAHLNDFYPLLEAYVKLQQYNQQTWEIMLDLPEELFSVKKGELIAFSGNTGGSLAPHLHFELRRTEGDVNVNPLLFKFPVADNTRPVILRLGIYDRQVSTYEQRPAIYPVRSTGSGYTTAPALITVSSPKVSFAISAFDTQSGSANQNGIYEAVLTDNGKDIAGFRMDDISYDDTRYLNANIDYRTRAGGGSYLQHLSELPGYRRSIYTKIAGEGIIDLSDGGVHAIRIAVRDANGNASIMQTQIQYAGGYVKPAPAAGIRFFPNSLDGYEGGNCEFFIPEDGLYDSVHIRYEETSSMNALAVSAVHYIGASYIPLHDSMLVRIKLPPDLSLAKRERVVMQHLVGGERDVQKVQCYQEWASACFREFGSFQLILDETPPVIQAIGISPGANLSKATGIAFSVRDNLGKISNFRAELDGKWLRFSNDKEKTFNYRFDEMCPPGEHELKITAEDEAGNSSSKTYRFTR